MILLTKRKIIFIFLPLICLAVAVVFFSLPETPEAEVRQRLDELAETVSLEKELADVERLGLLRTITTFFADNCRVQSERFSIDEDFSDKEIAAAVTQQVQRLIPLQIRLKDIQVTLDSGREATVSCTVYAEGDSSTGKWREAGEVQCRLRKSEEGDWQITEVRHIPVLKR